MLVASIRLYNEIETLGIIIRPEELYEKIIEVGGTKEEAEKIKEKFKNAKNEEVFEFSKGYVGFKMIDDLWF